MFKSPQPVQIQCCFTSTETIRTIRDQGGAQDGHLDFHIVHELCSVVLYVYGNRKNY